MSISNIALPNLGRHQLSLTAPTFYSQHTYSPVVQAYHLVEQLVNPSLSYPWAFNGLILTPGPIVELTVTLFIYCPLAAAGLAFTIVSAIAL